MVLIKEDFYSVRLLASRQTLELDYEEALCHREINLDEAKNYLNLLNTETAQTVRIPVNIGDV